MTVLNTTNGGRNNMEAFELQLGDWVSYLGDPVNVISLSFNDDEPIGIITPLESIFMLREKDVYPIRLDESMFMQNNFNPEVILWWRFSENDPFKITIKNENTSLCMQVKYVHELQHALRLCGLSELADKFIIDI